MKQVILLYFVLLFLTLFSISPIASGAWAQTLDLGIKRQVFYHCIVATGQHSNDLIFTKRLLVQIYSQIYCFKYAILQKVFKCSYGRKTLEHLNGIDMGSQASYYLDNSKDNIHNTSLSLKLKNGHNKLQFYITLDWINLPGAMFLER
jgi:hypothetical protein